MTHKSDFIQALTARGYLHQASNLEELDALAAKRCVPAYIGFDCTANSLHIGSLMQIMMLRILQQTGHKPIVLMGGGTTKIGDPSGKDSQRPLLSEQDIEINKQGIKGIFEHYLKFGDGASDAIMVDNAEWLDALDYIAFLRDYGGHFSVNRMLAMESVKARLDREQALSFLEFNYAILQAYDFMELRRRYGCLLQMGGSDQWGNIITGIDLTRRTDGQSVYGLTSPLITTASGAKMGKSASGAVWLTEADLPVWDFWQYWRNTEDGDVGRFLRLFTELPLDEIARLEVLQGQEINDAKIILANEVTTLCHSAEQAKTAAATAEKTFAEGAISGGAISGGLPQFPTALPMSLLDALRLCQFASSNGAARRLIRGGGARLNDAPILDEEYEITASDANEDGAIKISAGKKRHAVLTTS